MNTRLRSKDTKLTPKVRKKWKHIEAHGTCPGCSKLLSKDNALDFRTYGQIDVNQNRIIMAYTICARCSNCQEILLEATYAPDWSLLDTALSEPGKTSFPCSKDHCSACQNDFREDGEIKYQGYGQMPADQDLFQINKVSVQCEACSLVVVPSYSPSVMIKNF